MKTLVYTLALCLVHIIACADEATFSWLPNTESNLAGYKIHCGLSSRNYEIVSDVGKAVIQSGRVVGKIQGLDKTKTYYCAATAYDTLGDKSGYSNEARVIASPAIMKMTNL
jgi:hypothetical protein